MVAFNIAFIVLLTILPLSSCQQQCYDLKPHNAKVKKKSNDVGCAKFSYSPASDYNICNAYANHQIGKADMSQWGSIDGQCFFDTNAVVCMCVACDKPDILKQLQSTKATQRLVPAITACDLITSAPEPATAGTGETYASPEEPETGETSAGPSLSSTTVPEFPSGATSPTHKNDNATEKPTTVTMLDYETTVEPEPPLDEDVAEYYYLLLERSELPYDNTVPAPETRVGIDEERVRVSQTPSIIYGSRKQEQIYESTTLVLLIVNLIAILGIVIIYRAVMNATLFILFPDYGAM